MSDTSIRTLLHMTAPLRDDFDIAYHDIGPRDAVPRAAFVAGIHGNELNSVFVLARLREEVRTPVAGLLTGIRRQPLLYQGNLIARIQMKFEMDAPAETTLQGLAQ